MSNNLSSEYLLDVRGLKKWFPVAGSHGRKHVKAVEDVSLNIRPGETLSVVGESGCGKSTLARLIMRLIEPSDGSILFNGDDITKLSRERMRKQRRNIQIVFQDPYASLNPRQRVHDMLSEPLLIHHLADRRQARERAVELLGMVGLGTDSMDKFPHEFSGGQRQRLCIARALAVEPKLIICDECVSALDVSIQAQIINLLTRLQKQLNLTLLFISHDLRVVRHISDRVIVMYLGRVLEQAPKDLLFKSPMHPYTRALLSAVPIPDPKFEKKRIILMGDIPSPINSPSGCKFRTRCYQAKEGCATSEPELLPIAPERYCRCPYWDLAKEESK